MYFRCFINNDSINVVLVKRYRVRTVNVPVNRVVI